MFKYSIKIDLLSESIFSGGESIVSIADLDILYDQYGIPFYKAKSLKGNLREVIDMIVSNLMKMDKVRHEKYMKISEDLFGSVYNSSRECVGSLKFTNVSLAEDLRESLISLVLSNEINSTEIVNALTDIRYFIKIDRETGVSKDGALRNIRVLNRNLVLYSDIYVERKLTDDELGLLICGVNSLRHLGSMRSRGKGVVKCSLLEEDRLLNKNKVQELVKKVVG